jgi:hypothetical protein
MRKSQAETRIFVLSDERRISKEISFPYPWDTPLMGQKRLFKVTTVIYIV